jgi:hypothetical protein
MTKVLRAALAAAMALACASCADDKIDVNAAGPGKGDSLFVIGISPEQTRVVISDGTIARGEFFRNDTLHVYISKDGFIIGHISDGDTSGITLLDIKHAIPDRNMGSHGDSGLAHWLLDPKVPTAFSPCDGGAPILTFSAPPGHVYYLSSLALGIAGGNTPFQDHLGLRFEKTLEAARAFLKADYPQLAEKLEQGHFDMTPVGNC